MQAIPNTQMAEGLRVAVIVPLTRDNAALGKAMLNAAILANYDIHNHDITLIPMDQNAVAAHPENLTKAHINVTVGPLTATATQNLQNFAAQNHIYMFSLSNNPALSDRNTIVLGYRVEAEVERVIHYASTQGKRHILAIVPKDAYGDAIAAALGQSDSAGIQTIRFDHPDELNAALKLITTPPDAVFIPVSGANLAPTLKALAAAGFTQPKTKYLSTGLWDDATIRQMPALASAWYPATDPKQFARYTQRYHTQYGTAPPRLTALSYNAVAMIAILQKQNPLNPFAETLITNPNGFQGVDGLFRIMPDGSVRRALTIVEIQNHAPVVIDPAPDSTALTP